MFTSRSISLLLLLVALVTACALLLSGDAFAIDGNYSSPYASQWDSRNSAAQIPDATLLGMLLLTVNILSLIHIPSPRDA